jgi:hypothetical protein
MQNNRSDSSAGTKMNLGEMIFNKESDLDPHACG